VLGTSAMTEVAKRLLADIRQLAPNITSRIAEIEAGRRIPLDLVDALRSIGVFRMFVPQSHGGLELDLPTALEIIGALGRIDGSVGWTAMIGSGGDIFASLLQRETRADLPEQSGRDHCRLGPACGHGRGRGWRLEGRRTVAVRQRVPACRLDGRVLRPERGRDATPARGGAAVGPRLLAAGERLADRGHLVRRRAQGDREPSHRTQGQGGPGEKFLRFSRTACRACPGRCIKRCRSSFR
jgi:hypothetical protein